MRHALGVAREGMAVGEAPIGCVIARGDGSIVARAFNEMNGRQCKIAHAEIVAFQRMAGKVPLEADDLIHVSTLEPCVMCTGAAMEAAVETIVFGLRAPPDNGTKFRVVEFAPLDPATEAKLPPEMIMKGVNHPPAKGIPVKHPMMHRTRSLDYAVILAGEIDMMLDDTSVHLKQGDVIVQQATNHGWVNHGTQPCRILFVLMDSKEP